METIRRRANGAAWGMAGLVLGVGIGTAGVAHSRGAQLAPPNPQERTLDANLYMQTSAEYRAVCLQAYNTATERLTARLNANTNGDKRPAVVMDLDETVFDNSAFQSYLDRVARPYSDADWERWEKDFPTEVRLVPGAKAFIDRAESMGVVVVYLSNRLTKYRDATATAIKHLGLSTDDLDSRLLLKETTSDKTARRKTAAERYQVIMWMGDNLRDFSEEFAAPRVDAKDGPALSRAIEERAAKVQRSAYRWGSDWIILPNPVYGEWQKLAGAEPHARLRTTGMK